MLSLIDICDYAEMCYALNDPINLKTHMVTIPEMIQHVQDWVNKETWSVEE